MAWMSVDEPSTWQLLFSQIGQSQLLIREAIAQEHSVRLQVCDGQHLRPDLFGGEGEKGHVKFWRVGLRVSFGSS